METTLILPDSLYEKSVIFASARGETVEQLIVDALSRMLRDREPAPGSGQAGTDLAVIHSKRPGTLDLTQFDFDELLA